MDPALFGMENAWLIVGLGNPGCEYQGTRHNAGYMVVELLARRWSVAWSGAARFRARMARVRRLDQQIILCRPQTFMNASGEAAGAVAAYYKVAPIRILVILDDADLPLGEIRMRPRGGTGGHHGLESVERHLGTRDYARQRIGIGRVADMPREITDYVLAPFRPEEMSLVKQVQARACDQVECWLSDGIQPAMNRFNGMIEN